MRYQYTLAISYRNNPGSTAKKVSSIHNELEQLLGINKVFSDVENQSAIVGVEGSKNLIENLAQSSQYIALLCTASYGKSEWTARELSAILENVDSTRIIPVSLDGVIPSSLPPSIFFLECGKRDNAITIARRIYEHGLGKKFWKAKVEASGSGLAGRPTAKRRQQSDLGTVQSGTVIVGDIANFSAIPSGEMPTTLIALWECAKEAGLLHHHHSTLLDGVVIAIDAATYSITVENCGSWMQLFERRMKSSGVKLRIAVHKGDYCRSVMKIGNVTQLLLAGQAPNECSRLVRMAGPGQMVISEDYIKGWSEHEGWDRGDSREPEEFRPRVSFDRNPTPPHEMIIKSGRGSRFRFYKYSLDLAVNDSHMLMNHQAKQGLEKGIKEIAGEFLDFLEGHLQFANAEDFDEEQAEVSLRNLAKQVNLRISMFVFQRPSPSTGYLGAILRYSFGEDDVKWHSNSTRYSVMGERVEGPVGLAFLNGEPYVLQGLPELASEDGEYVRILSSEPWQIDRAKILSFQRAARCFIAIPMRMGKNLRPEAVLCVDTMDPLSSVEEQLLLDWANLVSDCYSHLVGALSLLLNG